MPKVEVNCTVSNCVFHAKGNLCGADKIDIDMDYNANNRTEFASEFDFQATTEKACDSADTSCKTFKPKKE